MGTQGDSGGAAAQAGISFQNRVAAWIAVHVLAEQDASSPWDLPGGVILKFLRCETEQPVDDLLVGTSSEGYIFIQAKRSLSLGSKPGSEFAHVIDDFVKQFLAYRNITKGLRPWERPIQGELDRLVLITGQGSTMPIRAHLPAVLANIRGLVPGQRVIDVARNIEQHRVMSILKEHLMRSWQEVIGENPTEADIIRFLSLLRVQTLNIDTAADGEHEAKELLRTAVLQDPTQADSAWNCLIQLCADYASNRSGADRFGLQRQLLEAGIIVSCPRSYQDDINQLKQISRSAITAVSEFSKIDIGSFVLKIQRRSTEVLHDLAINGSLLVVGEPGSGKSGAMHDVTVTLLNEGFDLVFFAIDRLEASSMGALRMEIDLQHNLDDILQNWSGIRPGFVIIDALDAARSADSAKTFRDLIANILASQGRWRVLASIRKFDLRYSPQLHRLFWGKPAGEYFDPEFTNVRHLNIPLLDDEEFQQISNKSPQMGHLLSSAEMEFRNLLRVPFNLRLIGDLIAVGIDIQNLTQIRTQIELLDRYWQERVIQSDNRGDLREKVLAETTKKMVEKRQLRVNRSDVLAGSVGTSLNELLSSHVVTEWQPFPGAVVDRYVLTYAHHMLFDYSVERLLLRGLPESFMALFEGEPDLLLAIRPSMVLHFYYLWMLHSNRQVFWDLVFEVIRSPRIPEIGKIVGPGVAGELGKTLLDFEPLIKNLEISDFASNDTAENTLQHLIGAILAQYPTSKRPLVGENAPPWCDLLERVSRNMRTRTAYSIRSLLSVITEESRNLNPNQLHLGGIAARRLLQFARSQQPRDKWLVVHALQAVCRTFGSDRDASAGLIRMHLDPIYLSNHGFEEMFWLGQEVKHLIQVDPNLVQGIYEAAFSYEETREDKTQMGSGRILPLTSTRKQDWQSARYELAEVYPEFLKTAPVQATRALISLMKAYVENQHSNKSTGTSGKTFQIGDKIATIKSDYSYIWDEGDTYEHDEPIKILNIFEKHMRELSQDDTRADERGRLLEIIISKNDLAVIWRRLMIVGTANPNTLGQDIRCLAWANPILICLDTSSVAGEFLAKIFGSLKTHERERIETAVLAIPSSMPDEHREAAQRIRDRLLGCLPLELIVTDQARGILRELTRRGGPPPNEPPIRFSGVTSVSYGEREHLLEKGIPVDAEPNLRIQKLEESVKEFASKFLNASPGIEDLQRIFPDIQTLLKALKAADQDGVHPELRDYAWGYLAQACERITKNEQLTCGDNIGSFVIQVLLEASSHPVPVHDPEHDSHFDEHPSWGSPSPRIEAASGLTWIARHPSCANMSVLEGVERLSYDRVPAVRFQVATHLHALNKTAPDLMWAILGRLCREETSRGVLQGLLAWPVKALAGTNPDRIVELTKLVFNRVKDGKGAKEVRTLCVSIFSGLYFWRSNQVCRELIVDIADNPGELYHEAHQVVIDIGNILKYERAALNDLHQKESRDRALDIVGLLLRSILSKFTEMETKYKDSPSWPEEEVEKANQLGRIADSICRQIYFSSGAAELKKGKEQRPDIEIASPERKQFLRETEPILDDLAALGFPSIVHHLLETLESFIEVDPAAVFVKVGRVLQGGKKFGYQYESLAEGLFVRLVERYLAEYRPLLRENTECRNILIDILDIFVKAGWPRARRLSYRLEEIYR